MYPKPKINSPIVLYVVIAKSNVRMISAESASNKTDTRIIPNGRCGCYNCYIWPTTQESCYKYRNKN